MNQAEKDHRNLIVQRAVDGLREHFDSVEILASVVDDASTLCIKKGSGDWYARMGMAREFLIEDDQRTRDDVAAPKSPPDDADSWQFL